MTLRFINQAHDYDIILKVKRGHLPLGDPEGILLMAVESTKKPLDVKGCSTRTVRLHGFSESLEVCEP